MLELRPHHGLCLCFFVGKGYNDVFSQHMGEVQRYLLDNLNAEIRLTSGCDAVCSHCPHNREEICEAGNKVNRYDATVLRLCGLAAGDILTWTEFAWGVETNILAPGKLGEVCGGCEWQPICNKAAKAMEIERKQQISGNITQ